MRRERPRRGVHGPERDNQGLVHQVRAASSLLSFFSSSCCGRGHVLEDPALEEGAAWGFVCVRKRERGRKREKGKVRPPRENPLGTRFLSFH